MIYLLVTVHVLVCLFLMLVILLQAGKGGGMGAAFGSAASQQVFGGRGAGSFLEKLTTATAIIFMLTSMTLSYVNSQSDSAKLQKAALVKRKQKEADDKKKAEEALKADIERRSKEEKAKAVPVTAPVETSTAPAETSGTDVPSAPVKTAPITPTPAAGAPAGKAGTKATAVPRPAETPRTK